MAVSALFSPSGTCVPVEECSSTVDVWCRSASVPMRTHPLGRTAGTGEILFVRSVTAERSGLAPVERMDALKMPAMLFYCTFIPCLSP